jgi:hypothetical protein
MTREKDDLGPDIESLREGEIKQGKEINPQRTADIGEAGQHAPGGYYNQQNANETHIDLDEQFPDKKG